MAFQNKDINDKIKILNETLLSIFNNFIPNKISKFDYKKSVEMKKEILKKRSKLDDRAVSNFAEKTELFNSYVASQCTPVTN